jgi:hypothetical protein
MVEQLKKLDGENTQQAANRAPLIDTMDRVEAVAFPVYSPDDYPVFHMITMNFDFARSRVSKETYVAALWPRGSRSSPIVANRFTALRDSRFPPPRLE